MPALSESTQIRLCLAAIATTLAGCASLSLRAAWTHMAELNAMCGGVAPHCGWCLTTAAFAALATLAAGAAVTVTPQRAPARIR